MALMGAAKVVTGAAVSTGVALVDDLRYNLSGKISRMQAMLPLIMIKKKTSGNDRVGAIGKK